MSLTANTKEFILSAMRLPEAAAEVIADIDGFPTGATLADGKIYVGSGANVATGVVLSGDATIINTGALTIANSAITNAKISASASIAFSKLHSLTDGNILVGNGSSVATDVALSGDATLANTGALTIAAGAVTRAKASAAAGSKIVQMKGGTIATTSTTDEYIVAPESGSLSSIEINPLVALTADDTNYITFTVTNLGQAGAGTTVMLAASDANTTKATGGTGLAVNTKRALTVHGTAGNLVVVQGDKLKITATATGTLANTVTVPIYCARFSGTT